MCASLGLNARVAAWDLPPCHLQINQQTLIANKKCETHSKNKNSSGTILSFEGVIISHCYVTNVMMQ